ncbi:MAG: membrane protein insertion efficiency factor YidD [Spirochaetales bacterium]|nr:membrane protein insertion efficiency factor YidD [Spirochaetales bacterium]
MDTIGQFLLVCIFFALFISVGFTDEREVLAFITGYNPVRTVAKPAHAETFHLQSNELKIIGAALVRVYQLYISPQDIPSCPFNPTDSEYARQAVSKYGLIAGILMASDRYQRCNGFGAWYYPRDPETGRLIDPVENNHP